MRLTPGVTILPGASVTNNTIYTLLAAATGDAVTTSDLDGTFVDVVSQTNEPTPLPGRLWWDKGDQLLKCYVDVWDGTDVSLWLAIGPDRLDTPVLATEPIPFGAAIQPAQTGRRRVMLPPAPDALEAMNWRNAIWEAWKVIGFNNHGMQASHLTAASGAWFAAAIDGYVWAWYPVGRPAGAEVVSSLGTLGSFDCLISGVTLLTGPTGISNVRGGLIDGNVTTLQLNGAPLLVHSTCRLSPKLGQFWNRVLYWGARIGRRGA